MVRTESRVPAGTIAEPVVSSARSRVGVASLTLVSDSNLSEAISVTSYRCTWEPTWKLISVPVPPKYLPLMRLPFLSSREASQVTVAPRQSAMSNLQTRLGPIVVLLGQRRIARTAYDHPDSHLPQ